MKILVVRHGRAVGGGEVDSDAHRYLTAEGRATCARVGARLAELGHAPTHLYTSPLVRAVQTAELIAAALDHPGPIVTHPPLQPGGVTAHALSVLDAHGPDDAIALVSHEPTVSAVTGFLMGIPYSGFPTAGVAVLEGDASGATLLGRLDPHGLGFG